MRSDPHEGRWGTVRDGKGRWGAVRGGEGWLGQIRNLHLTGMEVLELQTKNYPDPQHCQYYCYNIWCFVQVLASSRKPSLTRRWRRCWRRITTSLPAWPTYTKGGAIKNSLAVAKAFHRKIWMYNIDPLVLRSLYPQISGTTSLPPLHSLQCCDIFQAWWALLVKAGPFHEHSNQLWNISAVPIWAKVYTGKTRPNWVQWSGSGSTSA